MVQAHIFHIMVRNTIIWIPLKFQLMVSVDVGGSSSWFHMLALGKFLFAMLVSI